MNVTFGILLLLIGLPVGILALLIYGKTFPLKISIWYSAGYFFSQWMHVMIFVLRNYFSDSASTTKINLLYFYHVKWHTILIVGLFVGLIIGIILYLFSNKINNIKFIHITYIVVLATLLSQMLGSSIPKLFGEISIALFFLLGLFVYRFFLTYLTEHGTPPVYQIQSDALTSLGLLIALISIWSPFVMSFAEFLFRRYFAGDSLMLQFQLTRYAFYVFWNLIAIAMLGWMSLNSLIKARNNVL